MVIISHGLGYMVAVIVFGCSLAANLVSNAVVGSGYYDHHKWPFAVSLLASAVICRLLGDALRKRSDRIAIDKQTGKEFTVNQSEHTFFFIPMHRWPPVLLVLAVISVAMDFLR